MTLRCLAYRLLDRFRRTPVATRLFYHGVPVQTLRAACTVVGTVTRAPAAATDGDCTFGLTLDDGAFRHCEVTPCAAPLLIALARRLTLGQRIVVLGEERLDPAHVGGRTTGWLEIHPVESIALLPSSTITTASGISATSSRAISPK